VQGIQDLDQMLNEKASENAQAKAEKVIGMQ
jgi:hypothetical protein